MKMLYANIGGDPMIKPFGILPDGTDVVYLYKESDGSLDVRMGSTIGLRSPMYCTGVGKSILAYLSEEEPEKLWESNIFGKSVYTLIKEGLTSKLMQTPDDVRDKFRSSLTRIVNEGATGLICLIL